MVLAVDRPWVADPRLRLRTVVSLRPRRLAAADARFVVVHLDRLRFTRLEEDPESADAHTPTPRTHGWVTRGHAVATMLRRAWGEPHLVEGDVLVWDLERVRTRRLTRSPSVSAAAATHLQL